MNLKLKQNDNDNHRDNGDSLEQEESRLSQNESVHHRNDASDTLDILTQSILNSNFKAEYSSKDTQFNYYGTKYPNNRYQTPSERQDDESRRRNV